MKKTKKVLCRFCKKPIHIDKFAGITKEGLICNDTSCIIALAKELDNHHESKSSGKSR